MSVEQGYLQKQLYGIGIFEEEIVLSDFTGPGERRFVVTRDQLMQFFQSEITLRPFPGLIWMKKSGSVERYLITLPAGSRTILYQNAASKSSGQTSEPSGKSDRSDLSALKLALPSIALKITVDAVGGRIGGIDMWGFAGSELRHDSVLYELPLPNLSGPSLCLGANDFRTDGSDVRAIAEKLIFDTPFNWHHNIVGKERISFRAYHKKHRGRCPLRSLNKLGAGRNLLEGRI